MSRATVLFILFTANLSCIFANICIKSVFLHSIKPLKPSNKLFCIIHQNENIGSTKATLFRRVNHFRKYLPSAHTIISSPKEEIVELWDEEKVTPFEYPATKDGNRTVVSIESIPEKSHLVRWLYWNGTACINAVSMVLIKFITHDGLLEDISASVHYTNITKQSYSQQFYQFDAVFIEISSTSNAVRLVQSLGYDMGQIIRLESSNNKTFLIPSGMECNMRKQQVNIRFGIQINTACRLRITTCTQILAQIQYLLDEWKAITVYSFPYGTNDTVAMQNDRLSSSKMKEMDESCELITAASIQFAYIRFGSVKSYSHRLISYKIELSIQIILCIAFFIGSTQALGGIFGLKALTGNMPYIGYGNPWITYPRVAYGGAGLYSPYSSWGYGGSSDGIFGGYGGGNTGIYHPYQQYLHNYYRSSAMKPSSVIIPSGLSNSFTPLSGDGRYYRGRGNPWITQQ
ncbi:putative integral membrane protein [Brugia pahangi]